MNIVFVAGGLGTRFKELSVFPKVLLPTANYDSLLNESISKFDKNNNFYLIINNKYYDMVKNYVEVNHTKDILGIKDLSIIGTSVANGSLSTLADVQDSLPNDDILFVWSDIILPSQDVYNIQLEVENINRDKNYNGIIFTSIDGKYRYNFDGDNVCEVKNYDGNIPGVYYLPTKIDFRKSFELLSYKDNCDLVDFIQYDIDVNKSIYGKGVISSIIEYKDLDTYKELLKEHKVDLSQTRFFNKIKIDKERKTVTKSAINSDYYHIIKDEILWYLTINKSIGNGVISPKLYASDEEYKSFVMEYLDGYIPLHTFNDISSEEDIIKAYNGIKANIAILSRHTKMVDKADFIKDLEKEIKMKVIDRCDKISAMLINYDRNYLISILDIVIETILKEYDGQEQIQYTLCHGDLNGSNVMVDKNNPINVKFLDPRGYFGFTKKYGWDVYECSKLLYGLMGYDDFNLNPQIYMTDEPKNHKYKESIEFLKKPIYKLVVGVIYVALAGYISQDIMKANIAYEYGLKLIDDYYQKEKLI